VEREEHFRRADAYPGVTLRRTLRLDGSTLHDRYECFSTAEHDYDYAFHAAGTFRTSLQLQPRGPLSYLHVEKVSEAHPSGDWWAEWEQDGACYRLSIKGVREPSCTRALVRGGILPTASLGHRRRHAKKTLYDCTHQFGRVQLQSLRSFPVRRIQVWRWCRWW